MALFPDEVDVDNVAEAVVGVLKPPVGIPQKFELPAEVIVLVGELLAILAFPENWDFMVLLKGFTKMQIHGTNNHCTGLCQKLLLKVGGHTDACCPQWHSLPR